MKALRTFLLSTVCLSLPLCFCAWADTGVPSPEHSTIHIGSEASQTLYCLPDGTGAPFTDARDISGQIHDATITFKVYDYFGYWVVAFPYEDIWLESLSDGLAVCAGGTNPDHHTDINGETQWINPLRAGGFSVDENDRCQIYLNGTPVTSREPLNLYFNSADINGDLRVDILDIVAFQFQTTNGYHRSIDLEYDGVIDILDVTRLTAAWLNACE